MLFSAARCRCARGRSPALTQSVSPLAGFVAGQIVNVVIGTLFWVAPGVVYHDLRVAKEGVATAQLAAVFE